MPRKRAAARSEKGCQIVSESDHVPRSAIRTPCRVGLPPSAGAYRKFEVEKGRLEADCKRRHCDERG